MALGIAEGKQVVTCSTEMGRLKAILQKALSGSNK